MWLEEDDLEGLDLPNLHVLTLGACLGNNNTARLAAGRLAARFAPGVLKVKVVEAQDFVENERLYY